MNYLNLSKFGSLLYINYDQLIFMYIVIYKN